MKKFVRPLLIMALAAAIVLAVALYASTLGSRPKYQAANEEFIAVEKTVTPASGAALKLAPIPKAMRTQHASTSTQIARVGTVSLLVSNVDKAVSAVSSLTRQVNGDVLSLDDKGRTQQGGPPSAGMELRVPADRFEQTMQSLGHIGSERGRFISAEDLTSQIVDSAARLRNLRRTELDIQKIMDRSGSVSQILEAENQLSSVREQIETLDAELKSMRGRVTYSTISVTLAAEASTAPLEPAAGAQLVSAWREAQHAVSQFTIALAASLVWMAAFLPYLLLAAAGTWLVRRRLKRLPS